MFEIIEDSGTFFCDRKTAGAVIDAFYDTYRIPDAHSVSVIILDDTGIADYNRQLFKKDCPTDVITLLMDEEFEDGYLWGEIYISSETAEREAGNAGTGTDQEILLYIVHGLFHLLGYTDETEEDREHMWKTQIDFLSQCGIETETLLKG